MKIFTLLCRSGFNDLESIPAKWLWIVLQSEGAPAARAPGRVLPVGADGLILAASVSLCQSHLLIFLVCECLSS